MSSDEEERAAAVDYGDFSDSEGDAVYQEGTGDYEEEEEEAEGEDCSEEEPEGEENEEEDVFDEEDEEEAEAREAEDHFDEFALEVPEEVFENLKVALKPRLNLRPTIKELNANAKIGHVVFDVHKNFFRDANDEDVHELFDAVGKATSLRTLSIVSKGSSPQSLPISLLAQCVGEASELRELHSTHMKWRGDVDDFEDLADNLADHCALRVLKLQVEAIDNLESSIAAIARIKTIQEVELQTTQPASDKAAISEALQALCTSRSLRILRLLNVTVKFEILSSVARLLSANDALEELVIEASELDLNGGMAMAQMLTANTGLQKFVLKLDKMHRSNLAEEFVQSLGMNQSLQYFQISLDGRMSDMKVVREMQLMFRDGLKGVYKTTSQVGLLMGVTCERL